MNEPLWTPRPERVAAAPMTRFMREVAGRAGRTLGDYRDLHAWSVERREEFWPEVWRFCGIIGDPGESVGVGLDRMAPPHPDHGPRWFPGARLNFAENLLRYRDDRPALVAWNESGRRRELSYAELAREVTRAAAALRADGVAAGDRVAGFLPNIPEAVVAMLAATSLGAIWSSCSPDFGVRGVLDRFGQIEPKVLIAADGYRYGGKAFDYLDRVASVAEQLATVERVVVVPNGDEPAGLAGDGHAVTWKAWLDAAPDETLRFERFPFDHPVYILYSSGTTGLPKCMVHGAGGTLLQHQKEHVLHVGLGREDRILYVTTCGWMMWNWLASALATGAAVVLYDGNPMAPTPDALWTLVQDERLTVLGTSPRYLAMAGKQRLVPAASHALTALRVILSTGSPLSAHGYDYVYDNIKRDVHLSNISGGTEIISCFALGNPLDPVYRAELQGPGLGMAVDVFDADGRSVRGGPGELVCTKPFPSMPVAFWRDPEGNRYRAAYFAHYEGAWRHGDWAEFTERGSLLIQGRSDATLNPGGVRIGTAEIYRQLDAFPEVLEALAIGYRGAAGHADDERVVLFVRLGADQVLDDGLRQRIRARLREHASPRHVPYRIIQVADIPRTVSGKISELAVRAVVHGGAVSNREALANPGALEGFRDLPELRG